MYVSASTSSSSRKRWSELENRLEAEIESLAAQWRDYMVERQKVLDDDRASMVEQITAGSKKLKQDFETHAENLKDLMAQSCRAGMARLSDLEVKAEELEAGTRISAGHGRQGEQVEPRTATVFRMQPANATHSVLVSSISSRG